MQYDKSTSDARFLGIWYICHCTNASVILDNVDVLYSEDGDEYRPVLNMKPQLFFSQTLFYFVTLLFTVFYNVYLKL